MHPILLHKLPCLPGKEQGMTLLLLKIVSNFLCSMYLDILSMYSKFSNRVRDSIKNSTSLAGL